MTENEFDEFFRRKLHDYQSAVPEDSWAKIQRRSDEDRRRPFIWWTLAAVLFIGVATGGYFMLHHQNTTANGQLADQLPSKNNNKNTQTNADDIKSTQKDSSGISENNNGNKTSGNVSSAHEELNNIKKIEVGKSQGHQANKNSVTNDEIAKQKPVKKNVPGNDARLQNQPESKVDKPIVGNNDANLNSAGHTDNNIVQEKQNAGNADSSASTLANANKASLSKQKKSPENTNASAKTKKKEQNSSSKDRYIEIFASPAYGWSNTNAKAGYEDYLTEKKGSEKSSVSFNTGFRLMQKLNDHFFVKAGLQFTQVNQKFTYNTPNVYRDVPVAVQRNITTDAGAVNSYVSFSMARMISSNVTCETNQ